MDRLMTFKPSPTQHTKVLKLTAQRNFRLLEVRKELAHVTPTRRSCHAACNAGLCWQFDLVSFGSQARNY